MAEKKKFQVETVINGKKAKWIPAAGGYVVGGKVVSTKPVYSDTSTKTISNKPKTTTTTVKTTFKKASSPKNVTYKEHLSSYFGGDPSKYATEIIKKQQAGIPLSDPEAAEQFRKAYPQYFNTTTTTKPITYKEHLAGYFGGDPAKYATEILRKRQAGIPLSDPAAAQEFMKAYPQYFQQQLPQLPVQQSQLPIQQQPPQPQMQYEPRYQEQIEEILNTLIQQAMQPFESRYQEQIEDILSRLRQQAMQPKPYTPETDPAYQAAKQQVARDVMEILNQRGILNSTITRDQLAQNIAAIIPELQKQYYSRQQDRFSNLGNVLSALTGLERQQFARQQDRFSNLGSVLGALSGLEQQQYGQFQNLYERQRAFEQQQYERQLEEEQRRIEEEEREIKRAWDRVKNLGYVDNLASIVLGIPVGTPSFQAQKAVEDRLFKLDLARMNNQAALDRVRASNEAAMQRLLQQQAFEREQPDYQVKQNLWNKINNYGLDFLTDDEKVLAQSLLGIEIPGEEPPKIDPFKTNQALVRFLALPIEEREDFLNNEEKMAQLAQEGVDIMQLYRFRGLEAGE